MNTLQLIKDRIDRQQRLHQARLTQVKYRGVSYDVQTKVDESHGTFCYRGLTYVK